MGNIAISSNRKNMYTSISNDFIDKYISTDAVQLKSYIYLLSLTQRNITISSIESIATALGIDTFVFEESLIYWQSEGLISLSLDNNSNITGIVINDTDTIRSSRAQSGTLAKKASVKSVRTVKPERTSSASSLTSSSGSDSARNKQYNNIKDRAMEALMPEQGSIKEIMVYAERYLKMQVNESNRERLVSIYNNLYGNVNLVEHLLIYAAEHNKKNLRYLEKIAIDWNQNHIRSIEDADNYLKNFTDYYGRVIRAYGIKDRYFNDSELDLVNKWYDMFHTNSDLIIEACNRTISRFHSPVMQYTDSILEKWSKLNVSTMADVDKLDEEHKLSSSTKYAAKKPKNNASPFHYENQRSDIDFDKLEDELVNPDKYRSDN